MVTVSETLYMHGCHGNTILVMTCCNCNIMDKSSCLNTNKALLMPVHTVSVHHTLVNTKSLSTYCTQR